MYVFIQTIISISVDQKNIY